MTVRELIVELGKYNPDAEVHIPSPESHFGNTSDEIESIYEDTVTYGILLKQPREVNVIVLCTGWEGL